MKNCFVYLRKSTNRDDKQGLSLERQSDWVNELLLDNPDYQVVWLDWKIKDIPENWFIYESESAKQWWKPRPLFINLMNTINEHGCDYLIVYDPSRIARNYDDMWPLIKLMKTKKISKAIITEEATYNVDNNTDINNLENEIYDAKKDNDLRSKMATRTIIQLKKNWIYPHKFPFGYDKGNEKCSVKINTGKMLLVELAFDWRLKGCSWKEIAEHFTKEWHKSNWEKIKNIVENPIYSWRYNYNWEMEPVKNEWYKIMIDKVLFDKVQEYNKKHERKHWTSNVTKTNKHLLDKLVYDIFWTKLQSYTVTKNKSSSYKHPSKKANYKVNISENKLFEYMEDKIDDLKLKEELLIILEQVLSKKLENVKLESKSKINFIRSKISKSEKDIDWFVVSLNWLDTGRTKDRILDKIKELEDEIEKQEVELEKLENSKVDINQLINKYTEYFKDLPNTYRNSPKSDKADILRWLWVKFMVWPDKSITIKYWNI